MSLPSARIDELSRKATMWAVIATVSLFLGLGVVLGPVAWWQTRGVRREFEANGAAARSDVNTATAISAVVTVLSYLGIGAILVLVIGIWRSATY